MGDRHGITGDRIAELESIPVPAEHRGEEIGSTLMDACHREIEARALGGWDRARRTDRSPIGGGLQF